MMTTPDFTSAMLSPSEVFKTPDRVLGSSFSTQQKIQILTAWELDLKRLQESDDENMIGDESEMLCLVHDALISLRQ